MKRSKYILKILSFLILLFAFWFFYLRTARENKLIQKGNALVELIEAYRAEYKKLPTSLEDIGLEERDGRDVLYYGQRDSLHYIISFGTSLGESKIYYSDSRQWEDKYREIK